MTKRVRPRHLAGCGRVRSVAGCATQNTGTSDASKIDAFSMCGRAGHPSGSLRASAGRNGYAGTRFELKRSSQFLTHVFSDGRHGRHGSFRHAGHEDAGHGPLEHAKYAGHGHEHDDDALRPDASATRFGANGPGAADAGPLRSDGPEHGHDASHEEMRASQQGRLAL